jgi:enoyl-CoA hydratase/carnithine racemase
MTQASAAPINDAAAVVQLFEHPTASGHVLAEARLNAEATLNSLSLEMIDILRPALTRWANDDRVVALLFTGAGERAFCAGGDIQALYRAIVRNHAAKTVVDSYPYDFFEREYRLDYQIHTYPKPVIALGHGVVMGGGLGIFSGARWRIATERTRVAIPEVTIGLFPDAGATILLGRLPEHLGTFLGVTGSHINGTDAVLAGVATHRIPAADREVVRARLLEADWSAPASQYPAVVDDAFANLPTPPMLEPQIVDIPPDLRSNGSVQQVAARVEALAGRSQWIDKGIETLRRGCPASVGIVVEQLRRARDLSPADAFRLEMIVATHCANHPDFAEGVRALLIDKDNQPRWQHANVAALPDSYVAEHFVAPWPQNPLHDLETAR